jgi:hypothetical protein
MIEEEESETKRMRQDPSEEILSQLILNIKALMLLHTSQDSLEELVNSKLSNSHDEQVKQFLYLTQQPWKNSQENLRDHLLAAIGELVIASFLIIAGLATILPSVMGLTSPQQIVNFIGQISSSISVQTLSDPIVPALELFLAILLLLGAFHTVRLAALNLARARIMPPDSISSSYKQGQGSSRVS